MSVTLFIWVGHIARREIKKSDKQKMTDELIGEWVQTFDDRFLRDAADLVGTESVLRAVSPKLGG